jgi:hypothetical protein
MLESVADELCTRSEMPKCNGAGMSDEFWCGKKLIARAIKAMCFRETIGMDSIALASRGEWPVVE